MGPVFSLKRAKLKHVPLTPGVYKILDPHTQTLLSIGETGNPQNRFRRHEKKPSTGWAPLISSVPLPAVSSTKLADWLRNGGTNYFSFHINDEITGSSERTTPSVIRAKVSDVINAAVNNNTVTTWNKYYNGSCQSRVWVAIQQA